MRRWKRQVDVGSTSDSVEICEFLMVKLGSSPKKLRLLAL